MMYSGFKRLERLFISHSSRDGDLAFEIVSSLSNLGISSWIAPRDISPGEDWTESILQAITDSGTMLLIATDSSFRSGQVRREVEYAADKGIPVLAAVFGDSSVPGWLRFYISEKNCLFLNGNETSDSALRIMLMLGGRLSSSSKLLQLEQRNQKYGLFSGELRPVYVLWVGIGEETPVWIQTSMLSSVDHICRRFGALQIFTALSGVLHVFDSLVVENALEKAVGCAVELECILKDSCLKYQIDGLSICFGISLDVGHAISSSESEIVLEIDSSIKKARELAKARNNKLLVSRKFYEKCGYLCRSKKYSTMGYTVEALAVRSRENFCWRSVQLIAREIELSRLLRAVNAVREESERAGLESIYSRIVGIKGSVGLGKSRLVQELVKELQSVPDTTVLPVLSVNSLWRHDGLWDSALGQLRMILSGKVDPQETNYCCSKEVEKISILLKMDASGHTHEPAVKELGVWRKTLFKILETVASVDTLVVILEDIDRVDSSSLETLRTVVSSSSLHARILFVLTYSNSIKENFRLISLSEGNGTSFNEIALEPLNTGASEKFINALVQMVSEKETSVDQRAVHALLNLGAGNPRFLRLLVDYSVNQNLFGPQSRRDVQVNKYDFLAPEMEAEALSLLSKFDRIQRDLIRIASTLGNDFGLSELTIFYEGQFSLDYLADQVFKLVEEGVFVVDRDSFKVKYRFAYKYIRHVAFNTIPK